MENDESNLNAGAAAEDELKEPTEGADNAETATTNETTAPEAETATTNETTAPKAEISVDEPPKQQNKTEEFGCFFQVSSGFLNDSTVFEEIEALKFRHSIDDRLLCQHCNFVLWKPIVMECGHTICRNCAIECCDEKQENDKDKPEISDTEFECPKDLKRTPGNKFEINEELFQIICQLQLHCIEPECNWTGELQQLEEHFMNCQYQKMECPLCSQPVPVANFDKHKQSECENRLVRCDMCQAEVFWRAQSAHQDTCQFALVPCPNKCKVNPDSEQLFYTKRGDMDIHINNDCEERKLPCPFSPYGCPKVLKIKKMASHFNKYSILHLNNLATTLKANRDNLEVEIKSLLSIKDMLVEGDKKMDSLAVRHGPQLVLKVTDIKEKLETNLNGKANEVATTTFYSTFPYGYKIQLKLAVSGIGNPVKHLSVYISLCDSNFNSLLLWPFKQKIDVHLINHKTTYHISHSIIPNPIRDNFPFIQRPTNQRNPYFGIERFVKLSLLEEESEFVVDDSIFIKVNVEPHLIC